MSNSTTKPNGFNVYKRLLSHMWRYLPIFILGIVAMIVASGTEAGFTWLLKPILDQGFIGRNRLFLEWLPFIIITAFIMRATTSFVSQYCIAWVGRYLVMNFREKLFRHYLSLPATFFDERSSGKLLSVITYNVQQVARASTRALIIVVRESCFAAGLVVVMFINSWRLTLIFIVTVPLIAAVVMISSRRMRRIGHRIQDAMSDVTHIAQEGLEGYKVIRSFGGQNYEANKFHRAVQDNRRREMKDVVADAVGSSLVQIVIAMAIAVMVFLATSSSHYGISAGAFVSMIAAMLAILKPMKNLTTVNSIIQKGIAAAESIFAVLDETPEQDLGDKIVTDLQGEVHFKQVYFHYPQAKKQVLTDINLVIRAGETVALVGRSGAGKSSLANLIPRFYEPQQGIITIDGTDIREFTLASLRRHISLVSQHVTLFNDTVARNIAYGSLSQVDRQTIEAASTAAHAIEFIRELPAGFDTIIGENGVLLSGGQRQRLAIARAILKNTPILILDEATSALDTQSERFIQEGLTTLMQNRTTLVIAHRLSTIENADKIVVMEAGKIIEVGTHQQLLANDKHYAKLHAMQFNETLVSAAASA